MLRHCPITRFSSSGARRKMPPAVRGKETSQVPPEEAPESPADAEDVAKEALPPQKVLKIFSINIIAQGLPFCRRRVSTARRRASREVPPAFRRRSGQMSKVIRRARVDLLPSYDGKHVFRGKLALFSPSLFSFGPGPHGSRTLPLCCLRCICLFRINIRPSNSTG